MMDANQVAELRRFIEQLKLNPSLLHDPSLTFFKDYLRRSFLDFKSKIHIFVTPCEFFLIDVFVVSLVQFRSSSP